MNRELRILLILDLIIITAEAVMMPLWSTYAFNIGGDLRTAGIAISIFSMGGAIFTIIFANVETLSLLSVSYGA